MAQIIQTFFDRSSDHIQRVVLDQQAVTIRLTWNVRSNSAYMTFTDPYGAELRGIRVVENWPMLRQCKGAVTFRGDIVCIPKEGSPVAEITRDNLGIAMFLTYLTAEEVVVWENTNGSY